MKPVSSPTLSVPARIIWPPISKMSTSAVYMMAWNSGVLSTANRNVFVAVLASVPFTTPKRSSTHSPRTNALTARMAVRHSCTTSLSWSIAPCSTR